MDVHKFKYFLERYQKVSYFEVVNFKCIQFFNFFLIQKEVKSIDECIELINEYELDPLHKEKHQFSLQGFVNYLNDERQFINNPDHNKVYQNMNLPIFNYFINSSHNT